MRLYYYAMLTKPRRRELIARLVREQSIASQSELQERLAAKRIAVTQATLSRDLSALGVLKGPNGYQLPGDDHDSDGDATALRRALQRELRWVDYSGTTVMLRTETGHADALAVEIDRAHVDEVLGTIAGDDTIFVLVRRGRSAVRLAGRFRNLASLD
jgi:transcriptional regulator of arginine metabolism